MYSTPYFQNYSFHFVPYPFNSKNMPHLPSRPHLINHSIHILHPTYITHRPPIWPIPNSIQSLTSNPSKSNPSCKVLWIPKIFPVLNWKCLRGIHGSYLQCRSNKKNPSPTLSYWTTLITLMMLKISKFRARNKASQGKYLKLSVTKTL